MIRTVCKENVSVTYELTYKSVKNINLRVRRDGSAAVSAPKHTPAARIDRFVLDQADRIAAAQSRMKALREAEDSLSPVITDGAALLLLGERFTLRIHAGDNKPAFADRDAQLLHLYPADSPQSAEQAYLACLNALIREIYPAVLDKVYPRFAPYGVPMPSLRVREMKTQWGSCIPAKKTITLNARLIHYPLSALEYVTVHELCHFLEANHSARFYGWMNRMLPQWREEKAKLAAFSGINAESDENPL